MKYYDFWESYFAGAIGIIIGIIWASNYFNLEKEIAVGLLQFASIVFVFASVLLTLSQQIYQREKDKSAMSADLISLFRTEIVRLHNEFSAIMEDEFGDKHKYIKIDLSNPSLDFVVKKYSKESEEQVQQLFKNKKISNSVLVLANALEEFSVRVDILSAYGDERIVVTKSAFINAVEDIAMYILFMREVIHGNNLFPGTLSLYGKWIKDVQKNDPNELLERFLKQRGN